MRMKLMLLALAASSAAWGQTVSGSITGNVTDKSGAAIPRAQVTLTNTATGALRQAPADEAGRFLFASLAPGDYKIRMLVRENVPT